MAIIHEHDLDGDVSAWNVSGFPTHIAFQSGSEAQRVVGANIPGVQQMIESLPSAWDATQGHTLGSAGTGSPADAAAARAARAAAAAKRAGIANAPAPAEKAPAVEEEPTPMETDDKEEEKPPADPTANLDQDAIKTLTGEMGFSLLRAQKGLLYGNGSTVETAVEWLMEHQEDMDIDEPIPPGGVVAQSYKCNDCGKILSNMANLELHANKTGHSDFEESTQSVKPLTPEEKAAKIAEIKSLLKAKRAEREEEEKVDNTEREKQRRNMGKEMAKTREQLEIEQRKRANALRKKEKDAFKRERERLRQELAKDKAERQANKGKLSSKLGVDGYNPDGIQYDVDGEGNNADDGEQKKKKAKVSAAKIDEYITKVSSYKAGGDGGKCLKILKIYVGNLVDNPDEHKFRTINTDNKAFKTKVKPFVGAKSLLLAIGFQQQEDGSLVLPDDHINPTLFAETKEKLEKAFIAYG